MLIFLFLPFYCLEPRKQDTVKLQDQIFRKSVNVDAFRTLNQRYGLAVNHLVRDAYDLPDICKWRGVECTDGVMHTFVWHRQGLTPLGILMEWLPPTLQFLHLDRITMIHGWQPFNLPRALRYLNLNDCDRHSTQSSSSLPDALIALSDLRMLPSKMEEFILDNSFFMGQIMLESLPQTMRLLFLRTFFFEKVNIDPLALPDQMEYIVFLNLVANKPVKIFKGFGKTQCTIVNQDGEALRIGDNVRKRYGSDYKEVSKYYRKFDEEVRRAILDECF